MLPRPGIAPLRPVLVPGGAALCDERGRVRLGVREEALGVSGSATPEYLRLAAAHLAALHAARSGLADERGGPLPVREGATDAEPRQPAPADPRAFVLPVGGYLCDDLWRQALALREAGCSVVPVVEAGALTYVGPLLAPHRGPCVLCVRRAVAPNRQAEALGEARPLDHARLGHLRRLGLETWRRDGRALEGAIVELDGRGRVVARHHVRRFEDCPTCGGTIPARNARPPRLRSVPKHPASDTGARSSDPTTVWARFSHLVSPLTGAVRHVREVDTGAPGLIHVCTAGHAVRMQAASLRDLIRDGRDASGGKGSSPAQARASALCEALERFSSIYRSGDVDRSGSARSVEARLDPSDFLHFSEAQYRDRAAWNERVRSRFQRVPEPFDTEREIAWSRIWSLVSGTEAFVPTSLLYRGFRGPGAECCHADTNGLAAGETLEEAILQGFLELVERDAVALWWYNRTRQPAVDVRASGDEYVVRVFDHYASIGREAWVLDLTSDLGIPVYAAVSAASGPGAPEIIFGFGAHLAPAVALRRCVTEMNQMLAVVMRPPEARGDQLRGEFDEALAWWADATLEGHPYLLPSTEVTTLESAAGCRSPNPDILGDLRCCLYVAREAGLEVYVRDMTRADLGLPVVKVLVPGLRPFWRRLAPGRLYDVPVRLGRLPAPLAEADVNPVSIFV